MWHESNDEHERQMQAHRQRAEIYISGYDERPSPLREKVVEEGPTVTCTQEVYGLGFLVVRLHTDAVDPKGRAHLTLALASRDPLR